MARAWTCQRQASAGVPPLIFPACLFSCVIDWRRTFSLLVNVFVVLLRHMHELCRKYGRVRENL